MAKKKESKKVVVVSGPKSLDDKRREKRRNKGKGEIKKRSKSEQQELLIKYLIPRGRYIPTFFESPYWLEKKPLKPYFEPEPIEWSDSSSESEEEIVHKDGLSELFSKARNHGEWWNEEFQNLSENIRIGEDLRGRAAVEARVEYSKRSLQLENAFLRMVELVGKRLVFQVSSRGAKNEEGKPLNWDPSELFVGTKRPPFTSIDPNPRGAYVVLDPVAKAPGPIGKNNGGPVDKGKLLRSGEEVDRAKLKVMRERLAEELGIPADKIEGIEVEEFVHDGILYRVTPQSSMTAKAMGHHLRLMEHISVCKNLDCINLPLIAIVDYLGYRVMARALMPIEEDDEINKPVLDKEYTFNYDQAAAGLDSTNMFVFNTATRADPPAAPNLSRELLNSVFQTSSGGSGGSNSGTPGNPNNPNDRLAQIKGELTGTRSPGNSEHLMGRYAHNVTPPRAVRRFGSVPTVQVPLVAEDDPRSAKKRNTRSHQLLDAAAAAAAAVPGTPQGTASGTLPRIPTARHGNDYLTPNRGGVDFFLSPGSPHGAAEYHSPRTPGRNPMSPASPSRPTTATPRRADSRSVMAGFQHSSYHEHVPSPSGFSEQPPTPSPRKLAPARDRHDDEPLVNLYPNRPPDRDADARRIYYVKSGPFEGNRKVSSKFLRLFKERTRIESAAEEETTDLFANMHPRLFRSLEKLADEMNINLRPPPSHSSLNKSHLNAWKTVFRLGRDDRLYFFSPRVLIPSEPLDFVPLNKEIERPRYKFAPKLRFEAIKSSPTPLSSDFACTHADCESAVLQTMKQIYNEDFPHLSQRLLEHFSDPWWQKAEEHASMKGCLHYYGYHLDCLGELRRQLTRNHIGFTKESELAHAHRMAALHEVVIREIGSRVTKIAVAELLRGFKLGSTDEARLRLRRVMNLLCGQSPDAIALWKGLIAQLLHERFAFMVNDDIEGKIAGIFRRAVILDNPEFLDRLQYLTGVRIRKDVVTGIRNNTAEAYAEAEPFPSDSILVPQVVVKGITVPVKPGDIITQEAILCQDRDQKLTLLDWACKQFADMHAEDPYTVDHLVHWGIAMTEKAHLATAMHKENRLRQTEVRNYSLADAKEVTDPSGFFAEAERLFFLALRLDPNEYRAQSSLGTILAQRAMYAKDTGLYPIARDLASQAEVQFRNALKRNPRDTMIRANLGKVLVIGATSFPELDQLRPKTLFVTARAKHLADKYPKFARCLVVIKLLQSIGKIEEGLVLLEKCAKDEPTYEFAVQAFSEACLMYGHKFMSDITFIN